jgi:hypothetical protein
VDSFPLEGCRPRLNARAQGPMLRDERQGVLDVAKPDKTNKPFEFPGACGVFHAGSGSGPIVHVFIRVHSL